MYKNSILQNKHLPLQLMTSEKDQTILLNVPIWNENGVWIKGAI